MLEPGAEERLLRRALALGLLRAEDLSRVTAAPPEPGGRFGPRLDRLIALGRLSEEAVSRLLAEPPAPAPEPTAMAQTLAGSSPQVSVGVGGAGGAPAAHSAEPGLALAHTLQSEGADGGYGEAVVSTQEFPAPHWERYEFLALLGRGGMGAVYRARDCRLGRLVALKFILGGDAGTAQRFMQEARAQARLDHPCICRVYEVGTVDGKPYIALELIEGTTLDRGGQSLPLSLNEKIQVFRDAALALHYAHEQGIIHRDIKPSNLMIERRAGGGWRPVIMDFGLARDGGRSDGLTESGAVMGTPAFMSPEQARGDAKRLDRRSDVYSLGATLFSVLSGQPPFADETVVNVLLKVMDEPPPRLRSLGPELPEALELIVGKCLNKEPAQRYATARELAEDLDRYLSAQRVRARRLSYGYRLSYWARRNRAMAVVAAALLCALAGGAALAVRSRVQLARKERLAQQEAALAERLGRSVKDLEWLIHAAYQMPLHDTTYEKSLVRERMAEIAAELAGAGDIGGRLGAYTLGRGHLALHEWEPARERLELAAQRGYVHPELDYALGRVLGELYSRALADARRSGDRSFFERRQKELRAAYLEPALAHLVRCRSLRTVSASYVEGLLDFYQQRYDAALLNAHLSRQQAPWLYEAAKLEGDVHLARALEQRDRGEPDQAERSFTLAIDRYERAAAIGPSDAQVHEALAEAWTRWQEMDAHRGRDPEPRFHKALAAAERALEAAPRESHGATWQAFSYYFQARYAEEHGARARARELLTAQAARAEQAAQAHPEDAYAFELSGLAYAGLALGSAARHEPYQPLFERSYRCFEKAIQLNPRFPWALNDYAMALNDEAYARMERNQDPSALFTRALPLVERAIEIDPDYLNAYATATAIHTHISLWNLEHGLDSEKPAIVGERWARAALKRSSGIIYPYINIGLLYANLAESLLWQGKDLKKASDNAISALGDALVIDKGISSLYGYLAYVHYLVAEGERRAGREPRAAVEQGQRALEGCFKLERDSAACLGIEAQLRGVRAAASAGAEPDRVELERAYQAAHQAVARAPDSSEALLPLAASCLQRAQGMRGQAERARALLSEGLQAAERVLAASPGLPRALAHKGVLLAARAEIERDAARQHTLLRQADEALAAAFAKNPLLRSYYAREADALKGRLGSREQRLGEEGSVLRALAGDGVGR